MSDHAAVQMEILFYKSEFHIFPVKAILLKHQNKYTQVQMSSENFANQPTPERVMAIKPQTSHKLPWSSSVMRSRCSLFVSSPAASTCLKGKNESSARDIEIRK